MLVPAKPRNACSRTHLVDIFAVDSQASICSQAVQKTQFLCNTHIKTSQEQLSRIAAVHLACNAPMVHLRDTCNAPPVPPATTTTQLHSSASCTNTTQGEPAAAAKRCTQQLACNTGGASELYADKQLTRQAASAVEARATSLLTQPAVVRPPACAAASCQEGSFFTAPDRRKREGEGCEGEEREEGVVHNTCISHVGLPGAASVFDDLRGHVLLAHCLDVQRGHCRQGVQQCAGHNGRAVERDTDICLQPDEPDWAQQLSTPSHGWHS